MAGPFPTLDRYLGSLPDGLESYPDVCTKGAVLRAVISDAPSPLDRHALPPALAERVRELPSATDWVPEVHLFGLQACIFDACFRDGGGIAAFEDWSYRRNMRMFRSSLYRVLFKVVSPERLFVGVANRWSAFRRGSVIDGVAAVDGLAQMRLRTAPHVVPDFGRVALGSALRASLDLAGAREATVTCRVEVPGSLLFEARWR